MEHDLLTNLRRKKKGTNLKFEEEEEKNGRLEEEE
jgi:hypothetical protein